MLVAGAFIETKRRNAMSNATMSEPDRLTRMYGSGARGATFAVWGPGAATVFFGGLAGETSGRVSRSSVSSKWKEKNGIGRAWRCC
jgi:hypothetical protein